MSLDNYCPHKNVTTKDVAEVLKTGLVFIPAGCTYIAKPMDMSVIRVES